jgi:uncharacterized membrane protein YfcA
MQDALLIAIIFVAAFTQSLVGFGSALVSMAALTPLLGIQTAAPLVAFMTLVLETGLLAYYRQAVKIKNIWRVALASVAGIPLGVLYLKKVDEQLTMTLLGLVIAGYALYALLRFRLPPLERPGWGYLFGFAAGMLGGAYNTSGPPVIIYGDCRAWEPAEFKGNLQGFFLLNSFLVAISHLAGGNLTPLVWRDFLVTLPAVGLGVLAGLALERFIHPPLFRTLVLLMLIILGVRLIFG